MAATVKVLAVNRKAYHDYFIDETFEAGLVLRGTEIKSIRQGRVNLRDSYARIERGEAWLFNAHIGYYPQAGENYNHDPLRTRKLLLHRQEIKYLIGKTQAKGLTLIPLQFHLKDGRAKVMLGLARGKKLYDKRDDLAEKEAQREIERALRGKQKT